MSTEPEAGDRELRQIIRMLEKSYRMAHDASMTGALQGGKEYVIRQYNAIVANLGERGVVLPGYFPPLPEDASFDEVGVACGQLAEYLRGGLSDEGVWFKGKGRRHGDSIIIGNVGDLKEIGELIRESLPHWLRSAREKREKREAREEEPARRTAWSGESEPIVAPPSSAAPDLSGLRTSPEEPAAQELSLTDLESRLAELGAKIQVVAEQMRRAELPPDELQRLANELSRLGREQAQLAQEAAARRSGGGGGRGDEGAVFGRLASP